MLDVSLYSGFISKKLKFYRKGYQPLLNLTQTEMGGLMGVGQSFYSSIERGKSEVTHGAICLMASLIKVSPLEIDPHFFDPLRFKYDGSEYLPNDMLYLAEDGDSGALFIGNTSNCIPCRNVKLHALWYLGRSSKAEMLDVVAYLMNTSGMSNNGTILLNSQAAEDLIDSYFFEESEPDEPLL